MVEEFNKDAFRKYTGGIPTDAVEIILGRSRCVENIQSKLARWVKT